jgi:hypothetical protein
MKNHLQNGKLVAVNFDSREYVKASHKPGDKDFVMTRSALFEFAVCPSRWVYGEKPKDDTASTEWGSLVDCLLTDAKRFNDRFAIHPDAYPEEKKGVPTGEEKKWTLASNWCKAWVAAQGGRCCISRDDYEKAQRAVAVMFRDKTLFGILNSCEFQVYATAEYRDKSTGFIIPLKVLLDIVPKGDFATSIIDFKTARNANPEKWGRACFEHGYHVQAAMQLDIYNAATGEERSEFRHIVQENFPPYELSKPWLASELVTIGRNTYLDALELYARCITENHWPSYDELQRECYDGWSMVKAEAWMIGKESFKDPEWMVGA